MPPPPPQMAYGGPPYDASAPPAHALPPSHAPPPHAHPAPLWHWDSGGPPAVAQPRHASPAADLGGAAPALTVDALRAVFELFDVQRLGSIGHAELRSAMARLGSSLTSEEAHGVIARADTSGTGRIDLPDFLDAVARGLLTDGDAPPPRDAHARRAPPPRPQQQQHVHHHHPHHPHHPPAHTAGAGRAHPAGVAGGAPYQQHVPSGGGPLPRPMADPVSAPPPLPQPQAAAPPAVAMAVPPRLLGRTDAMHERAVWRQQERDRLQQQLDRRRSVRHELQDQLQRMRKEHNQLERRLQGASRKSAASPARRKKRPAQPQRVAASSSSPGGGGGKSAKPKTQPGPPDPLPARQEIARSKPPSRAAVPTAASPAAPQTKKEKVAALTAANAILG